MKNNVVYEIYGAYIAASVVFVDTNVLAITKGRDVYDAISWDFSIACSICNVSKRSKTKSKTRSKKERGNK